MPASACSWARTGGSPSVPAARITVGPITVVATMAEAMGMRIHPKGTAIVTRPITAAIRRTGIATRLMAMLIRAMATAMLARTMVGGGWSSARTAAESFTVRAGGLAGASR